MILWTASLVACTSVGTSPPSVPGAASTSYTAQDEAPPTEQTLVPGETVSERWWTLFQSPQLDTLVNDAITGSHTLAGAKARLTAEQEALRAARSTFYPELTLSAAAAREKQSAASFGLPPDSLPLPPNYNLYQLGLSASYTVDLFGRIRHQVEQRSALEQVQRHQLEATYLTLTGNTVTTSMQLAVAVAQLHAIDDILRIDQQTLQLVSQANQVGTVPYSDVVSARTQLATDQTLQPGIEQQLSLSRHALAVLLGRAPAGFSAPDLTLSALTLPTRLPLTLPSALLHQRPDILAAEAQLQVAGAQLGVATADLFPQITLGANATAVSLTMHDLFNPAGLVWSIAAGLTQPVFDAGMRRAQRRAALATFKAVAADYQQTVLQAFQQVADILEALRHDADLLSAERRALDSASRAVSLQRANYENGGAGIIVLLDAQREYQQALLGYVRADGQRYLDTAQLLVALGGGGPISCCQPIG